MERTAHAVVVPAAFAWTDLGTWSSLWEIEARDAAGNALKGDVVALDTRGSYVRSGGPLVATVGVEDLIVVATRDAMLVVAKSADQQVKALVDILRAQDHPAVSGSPHDGN